MRIGILQADSVSPALVRRHGDYPDMFGDLLSDPAALPAGEPAPDFFTIDACHGAFPAVGDCDAYLITGSRHSVYDDLPWIPRLAEFVADALAGRRRVVGICFGHQLIAHFFGGETRAAADGWCVGVHRADVIRQEPWMDPPTQQFRLLVSHQDQVTALPPGARPFAVSEHCPSAGFELGDALTFQGHPEFTAGYVADLMATRRQAIGETKYREAMASLDCATDASLAARWILHFLAMQEPPALRALWERPPGRDSS